MTQWTEAESSVINTAQEMINLYHPHLRDASIGFLMRDTSAKSKGMEVWAQASKVPDKLRPFMDYDFLIWVAQDIWDSIERATREALIDHELMHCAGIDGEWKMRGHDFEEFTAIIVRHGYWSQALRTIPEADLAYSARQLSMMQDMGLTPKGKVESVDPGPLNQAEQAQASEAPKVNPNEPEPHSDPAQDPFRDFLDGMDKKDEGSEVNGEK